MKPEISQASPLILASTSRYRAELLGRLNVPFEVVVSGLDETPDPGERPGSLAQRLARGKAAAVAAGKPDRWVLGSDQVPAFENRVFGKPGSRHEARAQLLACSGKQVVFYTAAALVTGRRAERVLAHCDTTIVRFRRLTGDDVDRYLDAEPAYDAAGSFKVEGLGISLFDAIESSDPTALIGLPLIGVCRLLGEAGYRVP